VGAFAGNVDQYAVTVAVGFEAGSIRQLPLGVAIGARAAFSDQQFYSVAIGYQAGEVSQKINGVAIGHQAGQSSQGAYSACVGYQAAATHDNCIVLNGSGVAVSSTAPSQLVVAPIRAHSGPAQPAGSLYYNPTTREVFTWTPAPG
jgi:hypothetical protein